MTPHYSPATMRWPYRDRIYPACGKTDSVLSTITNLTMYGFAVGLEGRRMSARVSATSWTTR